MILAYWLIWDWGGSASPLMSFRDFCRFGNLLGFSFNFPICILRWTRARSWLCCPRSWWTRREWIGGICFGKEWRKKLFGKLMNILRGTKCWSCSGALHWSHHKHLWSIHQTLFYLKIPFKFFPYKFGGPHLDWSYCYKQKEFQTDCCTQCPNSARTGPAKSNVSNWIGTPYEANFQ